MTTYLHPKALTAQAEVLATLLRGGQMRIYDGVQPTKQSSNIRSQVAIVGLDFNDIEIKEGILVFGELGPTAAVASGLATWYRCYSKKLEPIMDGSISTKQGYSNLTMNRTRIIEGMPVVIRNWKHIISGAF